MMFSLLSSSTVGIEPGSFGIERSKFLLLHVLSHISADIFTCAVALHKQIGLLTKQQHFADRQVSVLSFDLLDQDLDLISHLYYISRQCEKDFYTLLLLVRKGAFPSGSTSA